MEMMFAIVGLGLLGLLVIGSILGIVSAVRLSGVEKNSAKLVKRLDRLERTLAAVRREQADAATREPTQPTVDAVASTPPPDIASAETQPPEIPSVEIPAAEIPAEAPAPEASPIEMPLETPATPAGSSPTARGVDLEALIGGRWLNRIGIIAVLVAVAFFLKFAFDNDWVGPTGRVAIGLLAGIALLIASQRLLGKGYTYFSEGITALGGGVLFLSIFAAFDFYDLIPQTVAFACLIAVTAALGGLALGRDSERLAILALGAGFVTPGLLGTDEQVPLLTFVAILVACFLFAAWRKGWGWVAPVALIGTWIYFFGWYADSYTSAKLLPTLGFSTLLFAEFAGYLLLRASAEPQEDRQPQQVAELLLLPINSAWYGLLLYGMLYEEHRWWLTGAVVALGALHLVAARIASARDPEKARATRLVLAGLALAFVTAAIPIRLEGEAISIAWAIEGALLVFAGFRTDIKALRLAGLALLVTVIVLLLSQWGPTDRLFLNARFLSFAAVVAALGLSTYWARSNWEELESGEQQLFNLTGIAVNAVAVWGLSEEVWYAAGRQQSGLEPGLARQMGLSVLWAIAASLLLAAGVRWKSAPLRWQGLVLLGITVVKVFVIDLSYLERAYRIASFLVLGIVLLAVSFWYQKSLERHADDDASDSGDPT